MANAILLGKADFKSPRVRSGAEMIASILYTTLVCGVVAMAACTVSAETLALYSFNDGAAGTEVSTLSNSLGSWSGGTSAQAINSGNKPIFHADAPGKYIFVGEFPTNCVLRNPQSILFSKPDGIDPSNAGGKILFASLASELTKRDAFTLEFFFKVETESTWHAAFHMQVNNQKHRWKFSAPASGANTVRLEDQNGAGSVSKTFSQLKDKWCHFAMTYVRNVEATPGKGRLAFYIDHEHVGDLSTATESQTSNLPLVLGCSDGDGEAFWGKISTLRISDEVLEPTSMLYASDYSYLELETLAFWPFKDGTAGEMVDTVTNSVAGNPLYGKAHAGDAGLPRYSDKAPGYWVWSDAAKTNLLVTAPQSIELHANNAGQNAASSINFGSLATQFSVCSNFTFELFAKVESNATWRTLYHFCLGQSVKAIWKTCAPAGSLNKVQFERQNPSASVSTILPKDLNDGKWHHFASVCNGSDHLMRFYLDGTEVGSGLACTYVPRGGEAFYLGCSDNYSEGFCGKVSCLRVTQRALSPDEFMSCTKLPGLVVIVR